MQNESSKVLAKSPTKARSLIRSSAAQAVELDFECSPELLAEIVGDSRKYGVAVLYRGQEMILVESFRALKHGLFELKDTFRQRHLVCCFDISLDPPDQIALVEARAAELGDLIIPEQAVSSPYTQWAN